MSRIAEDTGIGRATLYKYFPDVETILGAWHERQVATHLQELVDVRDRITDPFQRLQTVLEAYALITNEAAKHNDAEMATAIHSREHITDAEHQLHHLVQSLVDDASAHGAIRDDVPSAELATYCINALAAAAMLPSKAAVRRLVAVTLTGLSSFG
jgi:AcrR family transcriptional regulator